MEGRHTRGLGIRFKKASGFNFWIFIKNSIEAIFSFILYTYSKPKGSHEYIYSISTT